MCNIHFVLASGFDCYRLPGLFPNRVEKEKTIRKFNCPLAFAPAIAPLLLRDIKIAPTDYPNIKSVLRPALP